MDLYLFYFYWYKYEVTPMLKNRIKIIVKLM